MNNTDVLIVSGLPLTRMGLLFLLRVEADLHVCGEANGTVEAMRLFEQHRTRYRCEQHVVGPS